MNLLLVAPLVVPMLASVIGLMFHQNLVVQRTIGILGPLAVLAAGISLLLIVDTEGIQVTSLGDWPAPFGIVLVADLFSAFMLIMAGLVSVATVIYSFATVGTGRARFGHYSLVNLMLAGVSGAFLTGDIFNLFVWVELTLISSFVLMALGGGQPRIEGSVKYVAINLVSSAFFLSGAGLLYSATGTLNMADLSVKVAELDDPGLVTAIAMLFLVSFGLKSAAFPLFFWLPASYHTPSVDVTALFSGLLTKVGVYALIRTFTLIFTNDVDFTHTLIMVIAGLTMLIGVLGAVAQYDYRRLLSFHIVSQIGYMLMGLSIYTSAALAGSILFIAHNMIVKTALFLVGGIIVRFTGTESLNRMGDLYKRKPVIAILFAIPALSLAGIPPSSGFVGKLSLIRAGLEAEQYAIVAVSLFVSLLTLYSMTKIWNAVFWKPTPNTPDMIDGQPQELRTVPKSELLLLIAPAVLLISVGVLVGILTQPILEITMRAADSLMEPSAYIEAVLGSRS